MVERFDNGLRKFVEYFRKIPIQQYDLVSLVSSFLRKKNRIELYATTENRIPIVQSFVFDVYEQIVSAHSWIILRFTFALASRLL
jgi:benzoyl-CoA reductase/2-hydroxyglutaryl-CoA dehydratase subunit BcrC/BadD/HgdB